MTQGDWKRVERWTIGAISLHSLGIAAVLLFATRWGVGFGGWENLDPAFFARQAGAFHVVVALAYWIEHRRYGGVTILVATKTIGVLFLVGIWFAEAVPWPVPVSALGDAGMGAAAWWVHRQAAVPAGASSVSKQSSS
jgi:hypothetical protein